MEQDSKDPPSRSDLAAWARAAIRSAGVRKAASELGIPRPVLLALAAEAPVRIGSLALARQRFAERTPHGGSGAAA